MLEPPGAVLKWYAVHPEDRPVSDEIAQLARAYLHKPTFCVWELAPVWHEQQGWVRFLKSARDEAAARTWLGDRYDGPA